MENYSFVEFGGPAQASTDSLKNEWELRPVTLPSAEDWEEARRRANVIFGEPAHQMLNASNVDALASKLVAKAEASRADCDLYHKTLQTHLMERGIDPESARMKTARATLGLVQALTASRGAGAIETLARAEIATSPEAMGTSFRKAADLRAALEHTRWDLFEVLGQIEDDRARAAAAVLAGLKEALESDDLAVGLAARIAELETQAIKLLAPPKTPVKTPTTPKPPVQPPPIDVPIDIPGGDGSDSVVRKNLTLGEVRKVFREIERELESEKGARVDLTWTLHKGESR